MRVSVVSGACAGKLGDDLDGGEVDLGQGRDRQGAVAEQAGEQDSDREQPGGDGTRYEGGGDVHCPMARRGVGTLPCPAVAA